MGLKAYVLDWFQPTSLQEGGPVILPLDHRRVEMVSTRFSSGRKTWPDCVRGPCGFNPTSVQEGRTTSYKMMDMYGWFQSASV